MEPDVGQCDTHVSHESILSLCKYVCVTCWIICDACPQGILKGLPMSLKL